MIDNSDRAGAGLRALLTYSKDFGPPLKCEEDALTAIADLICQLLHTARHTYKQSREDTIALAENGVGMWSAEDRAPWGEPQDNDKVRVHLYQQHSYDVSVWQLANDEATYGEKAGWYVLVSPDGEDELSEAFATEEEAENYAKEKGWNIVTLNLEGEVSHENQI